MKTSKSSSSCDLHRHSNNNKRTKWLIQSIIILLLLLITTVTITVLHLTKNQNTIESQFPKAEKLVSHEVVTDQVNQRNDVGVPEGFKNEVEGPWSSRSARHVVISQRYPKNIQDIIDHKLVAPEVITDQLNQRNDVHEGFKNEVKGRWPSKCTRATDSPVVISQRHPRNIQDILDHKLVAPEVITDQPNGVLEGFKNELKDPRPSRFARATDSPVVITQRNPSYPRNIQDIIDHKWVSPEIIIDQLNQRNDVPEGFKNELKGPRPSRFARVMENPTQPNPSYPRNIQEIIDHLKDEDKIRKRPDPFFPYKPENPSDVNLLAVGNVRFAPSIWANFGNTAVGAGPKRRAQESRAKGSQIVRSEIFLPRSSEGVPRTFVRLNVYSKRHKKRNSKVTFPSRK